MGDVGRGLVWMEDRELGMKEKDSSPGLKVI